MGRDVEYTIGFEASGSIVDKNIDVINVEHVADLVRGERGGEVQLDNAQDRVVTLDEIYSSILESCASFAVTNSSDDGNGGSSQESFDETKANASVAASYDPNSVCARSHVDLGVKTKWPKSGDRKEMKEKGKTLCSGTKCVL